MRGRTMLGPNKSYQQFGVRLLLHEGGPTLFGQLVQANLIDELFLTIAPQMAGRNSTPDRPALIRNVAFLLAEHIMNSIRVRSPNHFTAVRKAR